MPCPRCKHVHAVTVTAGHALFPCQETVSQGGRRMKCGTWIFALRFGTDDGPRILSIGLDDRAAKDRLLQRLQPETEDNDG